jgi:hypothetical protein
MHRQLFLVLALLVLILLATGFATAQTDYDLSWVTLEAGETSSGGGYTVSGTSGQPDAGAMSGGEFALQGGFWVAGSPVQSQFKVYLPTVARSP